MKYKALVLDLDGTLMNSNNEITKKTLDFLIKIQSMGIKVILASGRPTHGLMKASHILQLEHYGGFILSYNGGKIIDVKNKTTLYESSLEVSTIHELFDVSRELSVNLMAYNDTHIITQDDDEFIQIESKINDLPILKVPNFKEVVNFRSVKCLMTAPGEYLSTVEKKIKDRYHPKLSISRSMPFFLECMPQGIDKGSCIKILCEHLSIDINEVIACGDGYNDISMIETVGLGVAMNNGCQEIKDKAKYITLSNDEDGVVSVIEKFILSE